MFGLNTLVGRFGMMVPMLALAGFMAEKKIAPRVRGRFRLPACCSSVCWWGDPDRERVDVFPGIGVGPIVEQLSMVAGRVF